MRHRFTKVLLGLVLFTMLAGTRRRGAVTQVDRLVKRRHRLLAHGGAVGLRRRVRPGLKYGIQYATKGTNKVNGNTINLTLQDDKTDAATAVNATKDLIGQATRSSPAAPRRRALQVAPLRPRTRCFISGPAGLDAITGVNKYTFRSGRQTLQDIAAVSSYLTGSGQEGHRVRPGLRVRAR